jgi:hypothetical protein
MVGLISSVVSKLEELQEDFHEHIEHFALCHQMALFYSVLVLPMYGFYYLRFVEEQS